MLSSKLSTMSQKSQLESCSLNYNDFVVPLESNVNPCWETASENYSDLDSDDEHENSDIVKPKINEWRGENIALPVLGQFNSEFDKNIKSLLPPERVVLNLDPFYRTEHSYSHEPASGEAFVIWKNRHITHDKCFKPVNASCDSMNAGKNDNNLSHVNKVSGAADVISDDGVNETHETVGYNYSCDDTLLSDSETEVEIHELMEEIKVKREMGVSLTGESLWYDESKDMIRNLHHSSYSMTSYIPPDNNIYGKRHIMHSILSPSEIKMLMPVNFNCSDGSKPQ